MPSFSSVLRELDDAISRVAKLKREAQDEDLRRKLRRVESELEDIKRHMRSLRHTSTRA